MNLYTLIRSSWVFFCPNWTVPVLSTFPHMKDAPVLSPALWSCTELTPVSPCLVLSWGAQNCSTPKVSHQCGAEWKVYLPWFAFLMQFRVLLAALSATKVYCWHTVIFLSTRTTRSFFASLLSSWATSSLSWCMELFLLRHRTSHFPLLNLVRFLSVCFSSLSIPSEQQYTHLGVSSTPLSFMSSATCWWCTLSKHPGH